MAKASKQKPAKAPKPKAPKAPVKSKTTPVQDLMQGISPGSRKTGK